MKRLNVLILSIIFLLSGFDTIYSQETLNVDSVESESFSNRFLQKGKTGRMFFICQSDTMNSVIVKWNNGWIAIGSVSETGVPYGDWNVFDNKNRKRVYLQFFDSSCLSAILKINRKGKVTYKSYLTTPCF